MTNAVRAAVDQAAQKQSLMSELRALGIRDERVLAAIGRLPREIFVPDTFKDRAYENVPLPIGHAQTISQPFIVGLMTEALQISDRDKVLEVGTGSGYQAAVLAKLSRRVFTVERHRSLLKEAEQRFAELRLGNITWLYGDGSKGWPDQAPFDRIILTASAPELPLHLIEQLREGGILVTPVGAQLRDQRLVRVHKTAEAYRAEDLGGVRFVPLVRGLPRGGASSRA
jgi:protein-L-isoaspartate(D-aspartate) O-methyltransferase